MKKIFSSLCLVVVGSLTYYYFFYNPIKIEKPTKIVGLVAARNEEGVIGNCLKALSVYTDAIVVLDDASQDSTLEIVKSLREECKIEKIITKNVWVRDERGDKNALLYAGREVGGTHFILIDADEMFTAECAKNNWLRNKIVALVPGQMLEFPMMNLWGSIAHYRNDQLCNPQQDKWNCIPGVLCDDGKCNYDNNTCWGPSGTMHVPRQPVNRICNSFRNVIRIHDVNHGILHFKSVNLEEVATKKVWYMCLEYLKSGHPDKINSFYNAEFKGMVDTHEVTLAPVPDSWLDYKGIDKKVYTHLHTSKKQDILTWMKQHGTEHFASLQIWHLDWLKEFQSQQKMS